MICAEPAVEIPAQALSSPALLFLYYRVEQILGIKAGSDALIKLNEYLEKGCGASFVENPAAYENLLGSRERIFEISSLLTVNETYFFREGIHFELLSHFLPKLTNDNRPIRICSAASSIGCEAYSIAMLLDYHSNNGMSFDYEIDAFDVSAEAIETARNARYSANTLRTDGAAWKHILDLYLVPDGGEYVVSQNIRKKVRFFPYNIMRGLEKQYDVIFFRNALIYFSTKNRILVLDYLAASLLNNGLLFLGISETSSVKHPLLVNQCSSGAFYFQKAHGGFYGGFYPEQPEWKQSAPPGRKDNVHAKKPLHHDAAKPLQPKLPVDCGEVTVILGTEEGQPNAKKTLETLKDGKNSSGSELAASAMYFLSIQDFNSADLVLLHLEKCNTGAFTLFLRGEYFFLRGSAEEAERYFKNAAGKDRAFWPAFYRIASLAAHENSTRHIYRIKKACESLELGKEFKYECFLGGFSPDYFRRILEKKLA
jgi:chemotaxis protein methyltransferase CheR